MVSEHAVEHTEQETFEKLNNFEEKEQAGEEIVTASDALAAINSFELVNQAKELALRKDVDELKKSIALNNDDIKELTKAKQGEIKRMVEEKVNELKQ